MKDKKEEKEQLIKLLTEQYSAIILSRKQAAETMNSSTATLDRMREKGVGPAYIKVDTNSLSNNGRVFYPVTAIADYLTSNQIKCI